MLYVSKCIPKQMRLQPLPENVGTERRVSEVVRQRVTGHLHAINFCLDGNWISNGQIIFIIVSLL